MTAPFASSLCGYRSNGNPSTSDNNDKGSIEWGHALFQQLGVPHTTPEVAKVGTALEAAVADHLASIRPDLLIRRSVSALAFEQYTHLGVFRQFQRTYVRPDDRLDDVAADLEGLPTNPVIESAVRQVRQAAVGVRKNHELVAKLTDTMPEESMLNIDITIGSGASESGDRLLIGLSSKWSLRTDRAQDCVSQGAKLVNNRRGHMPHYAVLTMEPRPAMLKLVAYGSGSVDCVYHVALDELRAAAKAIEAQRGGKWVLRTNLERMVAQRRVRSYGDLVNEVRRLPTA